MHHRLRRFKSYIPIHEYDDDVEDDNDKTLSFESLNLTTRITVV